ncbi:MAG: asparagine synthase (glutamine-hydrolyzing) [Chitinophagaceae bacterium]|nr:asparagine synthase (glutamine-hydrolyzing) [Chitinophagaceae bacterium]
MCGISGFADFSKRSSIADLQRMNDTLIHRGPDGDGLKLVENEHAVIGLGHRRLAIIDLSAGGHQPKSYQHLQITYNGEVYNYSEIKAELIALGHSFETDSDTEVILHSFAQWGPSCIHRFIGMFAFAIYDSRSEELMLCRDRAGVKPLFYSLHNGLFLFASELKAIIAHPSFDANINRNALAAYLQQGYVPTPHCIYENTWKLKPGHTLHLNLKDHSYTEKQYWNVYDSYNLPRRDISFEEAQIETEKILVNAFQYRMVSDVPVGVFLSGGYDSSLVTALLQKNQTEKLKTFTIGMPDKGLDEASHAREVAQYLGTDHTEHYCTPDEFLNIVPSLPHFYDEPFADSSAIPTILVSRIARQSVTVALSADAGDEIFAGYNRYDFTMRYGKKLMALPPLTRKVLHTTMDTISADRIPYFRNKYLFHSRYEKIKNVLRNTQSQHVSALFSKQFDDAALAKLLSQPFETLSTAFDSRELRHEDYHILSHMMAIDYQTYLLDDILQKVDRAAMSVSLEGREPFLDHRVIEWAASLPVHYKYQKGIKKHILKAITHKHIPQAMMDRPKMGFAIPIETWLQTELKDKLDYYFGATFVKQQNIFDTQELNRILSNFRLGKKEYAEKIWYLLMFQMWYDTWMNKKSAA